MSRSVCVYIDASGAETGRSGRVLSSAGVVATAATWTQFGMAWESVLKDHGIPQFRMEDCAHSTGVFSDWRGDEPRRRALLDSLLEVANSHDICGVSHSILVSDYNAVNLAYCVRENVGGAYALCVALTVSGARVCNLTKRLRPRHFETFIEKGDRGQADLLRCSLITPGPIIRAKKDKDEHGIDCFVRPFELADMLAYEVRLTVERSGDFSRPPRGLALALQRRLNPRNGLVPRSTLLHLCREYGIPERPGTG